MNKLFKEDIEKMPAGPALDLLLAQNLGWVEHKYMLKDSSKPEFYCVLEDEWTKVVLRGVILQGSHWRWDIWEPSTNAEHALELFQLVATKHALWPNLEPCREPVLLPGPEIWWSCRVPDPRGGWPGYPLLGIAPTLALAISRGILLGLVAQNNALLTHDESLQHHPYSKK